MCQSICWNIAVRARRSLSLSGPHVLQIRIAHGRESVKGRCVPQPWHGVVLESNVIDELNSVKFVVRSQGVNYLHKFTVFSLETSELILHPVSPTNLRPDNRFCVCHFHAVSPL